ncbi:MAG: M17 family peptidase N-terminal domain-containing protein [Thermodesulfobacteriota bacterium]|nr:M17 family peptidase N-terminal domain-containing protein [Thermodesulfobacteriota bacterium]
MKVIVDTRNAEKISCTLLGMWCFSDERPIQGPTGVLDWYMDALISRLLVSGRISGEWGEKILFAQMDTLEAEGVALVCLGAKNTFDSGRIRQAARIMSDTASGLGLDTMYMSLPGSGHAGINMVFVAENFLDGLTESCHAASFTPRVVCTEEDVDEIMLGFQKTKVRLKGHFSLEIIKV